VHFKKFEDILFAFIPVVYWLVIYTRGGVVYCLFVFFLIYVIDKNITCKMLGFSFVLLIIVSYIFGIMGNLRYGLDWNDSSRIMYLVGFTEDAKHWLSPFAWVVEYLVCSFRNLNYNVIFFEPIDSMMTMVASMAPDFIVKRIVDITVGPLLVTEALNTYTGYARPWCSFGYFGMLLAYLFNFGFVIWIYLRRFSKEENRLLMLAIFSLGSVFSMFSNFLNYSGVSSPLYLIVLGELFCVVKFNIKQSDFISDEQLSSRDCIVGNS